MTKEARQLRIFEEGGKDGKKSGLLQEEYSVFITPHRRPRLSSGERESVYTDAPVDGLPFVEDAFAHLPYEEFLSVNNALEYIFSEDSTRSQAHLLRSIFLATDSQEYIKNLDTHHSGEKDVERDVLSSEMYPVIEAMLSYPDKYRLQLGLIFSQMSVFDLPSGLREKVKVKVDGVDSDISSHFSDWFLCSTAEDNLLKSISSKKTLVITQDEIPYLFMKFEGIRGALCVENTLTESGKMLVKGNWYRQVVYVVKDELELASEYMQEKTELSGGTWALMRPIESKDMDAEWLLQVAKSLASGKEDIPEWEN